jgi:hypothetical protein
MVHGGNGRIEWIEGGNGLRDADLAIHPFHALDPLHRPSHSLHPHHSLNLPQSLPTRPLSRYAYIPRNFVTVATRLIATM